MTASAPRALVTREQLQPLGRLLEQHGLQPIHMPLLSLSATGEAAPPGRPRILLLTSAAAVRFAPALGALAAGATVLAVGQKTAGALLDAGIQPAVVGEAGGAEIVQEIEQLLHQSGSAGPVWHVGARDLSPALEAALAALPAPVERWCVYRNQPPDGIEAALQAVLPVEVLLFASGSAAEVFAAHARPGDARVAVIGPATAEVARQVGLPVHAQATRPTLEGLVDAAVLALSGRSGS